MELIREEWTRESYEEFVEELKQNKEEKYASFHQSLVPGEQTILGIRIPILRGMAKEIAKGNAVSFLSCAVPRYNEEKIIMAAVIGHLKEKEVGWDAILTLIHEFVPYINNWSVCDSFCTSLKITKKHKEELFGVLKDYAKSSKEYEARFAFVMFLNYYMEEEYIDEVFSLCDECRVAEYYVQMAIAWLISVAYIKCRKQAEEYLNHNKLDDFTYNKGLQKIIESFRVTKEDKEEIRKRKRK